MLIIHPQNGRSIQNSNTIAPPRLKACVSTPPRPRFAKHTSPSRHPYFVAGTSVPQPLQVFKPQASPDLRPSTFRAPTLFALIPASRAKPNTKSVCVCNLPRRYPLHRSAAPRRKIVQQTSRPALSDTNQPSPNPIISRKEGWRYKSHPPRGFIVCSLIPRTRSFLCCDNNYAVHRLLFSSSRTLQSVFRALGGHSALETNITQSDELGNAPPIGRGVRNGTQNAEREERNHGFCAAAKRYVSPSMHSYCT